MKTISKIELEQIATGADNIYHSFFMEVAWKNYSLRSKHWYLESLLEDLPKGEFICGDEVIKAVSHLRSETSVMPKILDVGCGPVSSLAFLAHRSHAAVLGVDPLAKEYEQLLAKYGRRSPVEQRAGYGEYLEYVVQEKYDTVHIRNALDHTQSPCLTWLNLFNSVKVNGYLVQSHSIKEATKENWKQLHQLDLYPDENYQLWLTEKSGESICLSSHFPLTPLYDWSTISDFDNGWMTVVYKKTSDKICSASYLEICLKQMKAAYANRFNATMRSEKILLEEHFQENERNYEYRGPIVTSIPTGNT